MRAADPEVLREFETWLSLLTEGDLPDRHKWKAWFCVAEYELGDFGGLSDFLLDHDASGSFAFLGRDAETQADCIERVHDDGHEIVFHSHRHHQYADLAYEEAHDAITTGMAAIEDATGITPTGFFPPFLGLSDGAVRAVEEVGFDWVLGQADRDPDGVELIEPVIPFDVSLLEEQPPEEAMAQLRDDAARGRAPFLYHPPVIEYYEGTQYFEEWVSDVGPVSVGDQLRSGGAGIVLDCVRPVRVE